MRLEALVLHHDIIYKRGHWFELGCLPPTEKLAIELQRKFGSPIRQSTTLSLPILEKQVKFWHSLFAPLKIIEPEKDIVFIKNQLKAI